MGEVGKKLNILRVRRGLTLEELGKRTGFSTSFLSQLERGRCSISITSLDKIAGELGVHISYFFPQQSRNRYATRQGERPEMKIDNSLLRYEVLSGDFDGRVMEAFLITILPGEIQDGPYRHEGEEFGYVLQGRLHMTIENEEYELTAGNTIHFPSTTPHMWGNRSEEPVLVLWLNTHRIT